MPLGRDIVEVFEAIPARIEVSGHAPVWRVTGGSFDDAVAYAREAYGDPVVVAREDRHRWWPRVTLTVTTDPRIAAGAPPLEAFRDPEPEPEPEAEVEPEPEAEVEPDREPDRDWSAEVQTAVQDAPAPGAEAAAAAPATSPFVPEQGGTRAEQVRPDPVRPDPDIRPEGDPEAEPDFQPEGDPFPLSDPDADPDLPPEVDPGTDPHVDPELGVEEPESALEALFASQEDLWRKRPRRFPRQRQRTED